MNQDELDQRLSHVIRAPFRAKFHLRAHELEYARSRGAAIVRRHARELIDARLAPQHPHKDGRQTPWGGHPVFRAQHATATCCRRCLQNNHGIAKGRELSDQERSYVVDLICRWIEIECASGSSKSGRAPHPSLF